MIARHKADKPLHFSVGSELNATLLAMMDHSMKQVRLSGPYLGNFDGGGGAKQTSMVNYDKNSIHCKAHRYKKILYCY